jgi:hypothetical protein
MYVKNTSYYFVPVNHAFTASGCGYSLWPWAKLRSLRYDVCVWESTSVLCTKSRRAERCVYIIIYLYAHTQIPHHFYTHKHIVLQA